MILNFGHRGSISYATLSCYSNVVERPRDEIAVHSSVAYRSVLRPRRLSGSDLRLRLRPRQTWVEVAQAIGSGIPKRKPKFNPVFSFGSTAVLTTQIENSAPSSMFSLAADAEHIDKCWITEGLLLKDSSVLVYAVGVLALWIPPNGSARVSKIADLNTGDVHVIALANPKLAPYGAAAVETLQHAGIWDQVQKPKWSTRKTSAWPNSTARPKTRTQCSPPIRWC